jgi:hypothetical protein
MVKARLRGRNADNVINMDQTPIQFSFHSQTTLDVKGKKTIQVLDSTNDMKRITLAATVTASVTMLTPFMIFNREHPMVRLPRMNSILSLRAVSIHVNPRHGWMSPTCMHGLMLS